MRSLFATALVSVGISFAGCTTTGTGYGDVEKTASSPVIFSWKSADDGVSGTMSASLEAGRVFSGQFFEITSETQMTGFGPLWDGWDYGWVDWGPYTPEAFVTHYSGRVLANLADPKGGHVRCHFRLAHPDAGMSGGGSGECQMQGGEKIDATFPPS